MSVFKLGKDKLSYLKNINGFIKHNLVKVIIMVTFHWLSVSPNELQNDSVLRSFPAPSKVSRIPFEYHRIGIGFRMKILWRSTNTKIFIKRSEGLSRLGKFDLRESTQKQIPLQRD